ncbi:MAG: hypothetical protein HY036_00595 [Nitrospirae bacterium]|nr:hypothetical protein [Nitrospirota bacterium]MBI3351053.1 hypothetical protein [Nitrospirota bacterium]
MKTGATPFFVLLVISLVLGACASSLRTLAFKKDATSQELLHLFAQREKARQEMKAMVSFSIHPNQGASQALNGILSFEPGDHVRFQGFDSFGRTVIDLTLLKNFYKISLGGDPPLRGNLEDRGDLSAKMGPGAAEKINWEFWLKMMNEFRYGGNPVLMEDEMIFIEKGKDHFTGSVLKIKGKQAILLKKIWFERSFFYPVKEEIYEEMTGDYPLSGTIYFSDFNDKNNGSWPGRIQVKSKEGDLEVEFVETNFSPSFLADYFNLD